VAAVAMPEFAGGEALGMAAMKVVEHYITFLGWNISIIRYDDKLDISKFRLCQSSQCSACARTTVRECRGNGGAAAKWIRRAWRIASRATWPGRGDREKARGGVYTLKSELL
jgi:hypothetical protein